MNYTNDEYQLTSGEQVFMQRMLADNGCNASTPEDLVDDNLSCQQMMDFKLINPNLNKRQIGGYVSSLIIKGVIWHDERDRIDGDDLYWVDDGYLESLPQDLQFHVEIN